VSVEVTEWSICAASGDGKSGRLGREPEEMRTEELALFSGHEQLQEHLKTHSLRKKKKYISISKPRVSAMRG